MTLLVYTLACNSMTKLISMECMKAWALSMLKDLHKSCNPVLGTDSFCCQDDMTVLVYTLTCNSMNTFISVECMEVWPLSMKTQLYYSLDGVILI